MKKTPIAATFATAALLPLLLLVYLITARSARAEVAANIGWVSDYIFRGVFQEDSSAYAGIDYTGGGGFYAGTWLADVGQGLESDVYLGFAGGDNVNWKLGYTGYFYTDDFDDTYNEMNMGLGYDIVNLDVAVGRWSGFGEARNYTFTTLTVTPYDGFYLRLGHFGRDFDGDYFESGYSWTLEQHAIDLSITVVASNDLDVSDGDDGEDGSYALVFGIKKRFSLTQ